MVKNNAQKYADFQRMKETIDGHIDSVSYSGADIKAVVFLPLDEGGIKRQRDEYRNKMLELSNTYDELVATGATFSNDLEDALEDWDAEESPESLAAVNAAETLLRRHQEINSDISLKSIMDQIAAYDLLIDRLNESINDNLPGGYSYEQAVVLGDLQTITYSIHREKFPVRTLGRVYAKSYTRGPRTIAGSMIFTVMNKAALWDLLQKGLTHYSTGVTGSDDGAAAAIEASTILVDQLPPFDITLIFSNEVGDNSSMVLYGVEIVNEGQTMSIQDLLTENVMQFVARDLDPLRQAMDKRAVFQSEETATVDASALLSGYRRDQRTNPFL